MYDYKYSSTSHSYTFYDIDKQSELSAFINISIFMKAPDRCAGNERGFSYWLGQVVPTLLRLFNILVFYFSIT